MVIVKFISLTALLIVDIIYFNLQINLKGKVSSHG